MTVVIRSEGLSKKYRRGLTNDSGLRHVLDRLVRSPLEVFRRKQHEEFWALKDVSLEVHDGEVLGLIGRNGSGKTTLLKILSRITKPTSGWAEIRGRVGSLLEVGTGFHPELTGRENAFLSGAILGMRRAEIARKFDEIVAFAELEKFIDTPVKHYSSGMYVRLAFAVAAHLEPEILLVDEVLAVGDINFQKKCLGKMGDVARAGRTVVLVSHQLNQMRRLCDRVVWVDGGAIRMIGAAHEVVSAYESAMSSGDLRQSAMTARSELAAEFKGWEIDGVEPDNRHKLESFGPVTIKFALQVNAPIRHGHHGVALFNHNREIVWGRAIDGLKLEVGRHELRHAFPMLPLRPGLYTWTVSFWEQSDLMDTCECVPELCVVTDSHQHPDDRWNGILNFPVPFAAERTTDVRATERN